MLKQLIKVTPYFIFSLMISGIMALLEANLMINMTKLMDFAISGNAERFKDGIPLLVFIAVVSVPACILHSFTYGLYKKKANIALKNYYLKGVFKKNISEFHKENNAKYLSGLTNDLNTIEANLIDSIYEVGRCILSFAAGVWMIVSVTPTGLYIILGVAAFNILFSSQSTKPVGKKTSERSELFESYTSYIKEVISAFHIIKSNNLQERIRTNFNHKSEEVQQKGYVIDKLLSYTQAIQNLSMSGTMYFLLLMCTYSAMTGAMTIGGALLVIQGTQNIMWPVMNLAERMPKLFVVKDLIKKIEVTLQNTDTYEETIAFEGLQETIQLDQVSFGYEEGLILDQVSTTLKKGGKYLVVGPSGGGKSTLLKLLRKYFNPTRGEILLDGKPLKDIKKEDFYRHIANVEQQVFIFEDTLRNNITLYKSYTEEEVKSAIERAGLTEFVANLPEGLDTMIYDNGSNISGGERSRVVIARGLLAQASIIFLDEAFAALDMERAKEIEESILALEDVTVINVSHVVFKENKSRYDGVFTVAKQQVEISEAC